MEQPVYHDHFEHRTGPGLGNAFAVHSGCIDGLKVHSGDAVDKFLDTNAWLCPFPIDFGNDDLVIVFKIGRDLLGIVSFRHEVEFILERLRQVLDDLLRVIGGQLRHMPFGQRRQMG